MSLKVVFWRGTGQHVHERRADQRRWAQRGTALLAGTVGVLAAATSTATASQPGPLTYVALGDSYSSGVGTGVYDPASGDCARSPLSYPPLWAAAHRPDSFRFAACSGATTDDVRSSQIPALPVDTDLVTITVGGNDAAFQRVLVTCTFATSDDTCFDGVDAAEAFVRTELPGRLARAYTAIRGAAPRAQVIVLGYPRLYDLAPGCGDPLAPNLARRGKLNEGADVLNTVIGKTVSQQPGFSFVDVQGRFAGHGVCSVDPWINGPSVPPLVGPYHPNQTGYRDGYFDALDADTTARGVAAA